MTEVAQDFGLEREFTGLSYRERGMAREGGEHVGQAGTAAHRRGEYVAAIARNQARRERDDAREMLTKARRRAQALKQLQRSLDRAAPTLAAMHEIPGMTDLGDDAFAPDIRAVPGTVPLNDDLPAAPVLDGCLPQLFSIGRAAPSMATPPVEGLTNLAKAAPVVATSPPLYGLQTFNEKGGVSTFADPPGIALAPGFSAPPAIESATLPTSAPAVDPAPLLVNLGRQAPNLRSGPRMIVLGKPAPRLQSATFRLWSIGSGITLDHEGEAIAARIISIVERESRRRHEAANARPLDPFDQIGKTIIDRDFERLLALLESNPSLLVVHEGEIHPGDGLPDHLRKAMHGYAAHPRARARMLNVAEKAKAGSSKLAAGNARQASGPAKPSGTASPERSESASHPIAPRTAAEILGPWAAAAKSVEANTQLSEQRIRQLREKQGWMVQERSAALLGGERRTADRTSPDR